MSDYAVVMGDETLGIFDNLGEAVEVWRPRRKDGARIVNMLGDGSIWAVVVLGDGSIWAVVVGDAAVRARGKPRGRRRWVGSVPIGWTQPPQRGMARYRLTKAEGASLHPGMTVVRITAEGRGATERRRRRG